MLGDVRVKVYYKGVRSKDKYVPDVGSVGRRL